MTYKTPMMLAREQTNDCSCGSSPSFIRYPEFEYSVKCEDCGRQTDRHPDPFDAKDAWNEANLAVVQLRLL